MKTTIAAALLTCVAGASAGQATIEFLPSGYAVTDLSHDGQVAVGNVIGDGSYETFRWDAETGAVRLGRASVPAIGAGAGSPDVSRDGQFISASILSSDNMLTLGLWSAVDGWHEAFPTVPGGIVQDQSYGSAWGLSGNGQVVAGLNYGGTPRRAWACTWTLSGGIVNYPQTAGMNARLNAANFDGTTVVGWVDSGGPWWPTAWRDGVRYPLVTSGEVGGGGEGYSVNNDGSIIAGKSYDFGVATRVATIWTWNGTSYIINRIGMLPGTTPSFGQAQFNDISNDGQIAVGSNIYTQSPGGERAGIVWTPSTGLMKDTDYLASLGLLSQLPPNFVSREMTAVSADGSAIAGLGLFTDHLEYRAYLIHLAPPPPACPGDANGDNSIDGADLSVLLAQFSQNVAAGTGADFNGDAVVNGADLSVLLSNFGASCN